MLLIKKTKQWGDVNLPSGKLIATDYLLIDADASILTPQQVIDFNVRDVTDAQLISDLQRLDHDVWDGEVRRMTTGPNPLSDPLTGDDLASHLRGAKYIAKRNASIAYAGKYQALSTKEGALEQASWAQQLQEAQSYVADNQAPTPLLSMLAEVRGVTVAQFANTVVAAAAAYTQSRDDLLSELRTIHQQIDEATTAVELKNLGWY